MLSQQLKERFQREPAQFIIEEIQEFARTSPLNRMPPDKADIIFDQPLVKFADGFITERGIAHRCGSVVTDLALPASPRTTLTPFSNCLFYFDGSCKTCVKRCPAGAITDGGYDKIKCGAYLRDIGYSAATLKEGYDIDKSVFGCGLCQAKVPCEYQVPAKIQKKEQNS